MYHPIAIRINSTELALYSSQKRLECFADILVNSQIVTNEALIIIRITIYSSSLYAGSTLSTVKEDVSVKQTCDMNKKANMNI